MQDPDFGLGFKREKRKAEDDLADNQDIKKVSRGWAGGLAELVDGDGGLGDLVGSLDCSVGWWGCAKNGSTFILHEKGRVALSVCKI